MCRLFSSQLDRQPCARQLPAFLGLSTLLAFVLAIVLYDAVSRRRIHAATLLGGGCLMTAKIVCFTIARSEVGLSLARHLA